MVTLAARERPAVGTVSRLPSDLACYRTFSPRWLWTAHNVLSALARAGPGEGLDTTSGFSQTSKKKKKRRRLAHLFIIFSALNPFLLESSDQGHSGSGHQVTSSDLTSEKV